MITLEQLPLVAMASMNDTHLEETLIINQLEKAKDSQDVKAVKVALQELLAHTIEHFSREEKMMQETNFPAFEVHKEEHQKHLHSLKSVVSFFDEREDFMAIRAYIDGNLVPWMMHHIETMDTVSAQFLQEAGA